jgi:hypothetical protein
VAAPTRCFGSSCVESLPCLRLATCGYTGPSSASASAPAGSPSATSVALPLGVLAVEGVFSHDLHTHHSRLHWRLCASWDVGVGHVGRKQALPSPFPRVKPALRWDVRTLAPPEIEGEVGGESNFAYDIGRFHCSLPALQATLEL